MDKDLIIEMQRHQIVELLSINAHLSLGIEGLTARVLELESNQKKNSGNSSKPPSTDIGKVKKTQSLRSQSGKSRGGQPGHQGDTLKFSGTPDIIEVHDVTSCSSCGKDLTVVDRDNYQCRQVFDIPPIRIQVTEHRIASKVCPACHLLNTASFPSEVTQPVQYGKGIQKLAVYLSNYQLLPYRRTAELFEDLLRHRINEGSLVAMNQRCSANLNGFIEELKGRLGEQPVLHADETGYYYGSKRNWLHVLTTEQHTLYMPHAKRGTEAMDEMGVLPDYKGRLIHDFWKPYNEYSCAHGLCNVHHLRDLTFCADVEKSDWAAQMKQFLLDLHQQVHQAKQANAKALTTKQLCYWQNQYEYLLKVGQQAHPPPEKQPGKRGATKKTKTQNMLQRFEQYKESILAFVHDFNVPFGNNLAEQAIRMMKVKQKISGCFRSEQGAIDFATIRSYIATIKKQGINVIDALELTVLGNPICLA